MFHSTKLGFHGVFAVIHKTAELQITKKTTFIIRELVS